ncbi:cell division protein FtsL [Pseudaestuariivita sp.]|uniref:cell division protein FtsL n=1 Tax=Pseudaestuariivita sp. TaxID=2211669 RepID=UPI004057D32D
MRSFLYIVTSCLVIALAFWAYQQNYATQASLSEASQTRAEIRAAQARLSVLKAEWAYLNRPARLQELVESPALGLGLGPLRPEQFGRIDQVSFPPAPQPAMVITNSVEVSSQNAPQPEGQEP